MSIARIRNRSARLLAYAVAGLFGLACLIIGGSWFVVGKGMFVAGFPATLAEAVAAAAGGTAVMLWAAARLGREIRTSR